MEIQSKVAKTWVLIISLLVFNILTAQQGKYVRKSVSSLESVWFKPGSLGGLQFDSKTFDKFIDHYVEVPRFDYNVLPSNLLQEFRREANSIEEVSADALSKVLENTVTGKIVEILNDPDVMQKRGLALKDESAFQSFAATKAKSLGLTTDELKTLMNSAYIYLPYISSAKQETDGADLTVTIEGGIIWWQMKMSGDGSTSVEEVLSATTKAFSTIDPSATDPLTKKPLYDEFQFGAEKWPTTPNQYCQNDAMLAFAKNLGVKTKEIDDFKLQAQIVEADGKKYAFPLGFNEGVHLDDGFHIVEFVEDDDGNEVVEKVGFARVSKTGDNISDPNNFTYANQLLGSKVSEGTMVLEHPRLGMDARAKLGFLTGMNIPKEYITAGYDTLFADDISGGLALDVIFAYNLAPVIGISQTFLDIEMTFAFPTGKLNPDLSETPDVAPFLFSFYGGASHKIWLPPSSNVTVGGGFGIESFNLAGTVLGYDYVYSVRSLAFKIGADFERMINADLSWNVGLAYKLALKPSQLALTYGDFEYTYTGDDVSDLYPDLNLSGLMINVGVNYALAELPINLFGFLDPFKKH